MTKYLIFLTLVLSSTVRATEQDGWVRDQYCDSTVKGVSMSAVVLGGQRPGDIERPVRIPPSDKLCLINIGLDGNGFKRTISVRDDGLVSMTDNVNDVLKSEFFYLVPRSQTKVDLRKKGESNTVEIQWPYDGTATVDSKNPVLKSDALSFSPSNLGQVPLHSVQEFALKPKSGIAIDLGMARNNSPVLEAIRTGNFDAPVKMVDASGNQCKAIPMSALLEEKSIDTYRVKYEAAKAAYEKKKDKATRDAKAIAERKKKLTSDYAMISDDRILMLIKANCKNLDVSYLEQETFINGKAKLSLAPSSSSKGRPGQQLQSTKP